MQTKKRVMDMGGKFGNWTVLEKHGRQVLCQCDCGTQTHIPHPIASKIYKRCPWQPSVSQVVHKNYRTGLFS
jgi:hypothetical protein